MKRLKLFPKTFLYVFSLMAAISLISHALFYFMMPIVYTARKEAGFQDAQEQLIRALKDASPDSVADMVSRYALQYQMGVFLYYDGEMYNHMAEGGSPADGGHSFQETVNSYWSLPNDGPDIDRSCFRNDFYTRTNAQLCSGTHFDTAEGTPCYLVLLSTLQPVSEAKEAVLVFLPFTLALSLLLAVVFALLYSGKIAKPLSEISAVTARMKELDPQAACRVETRDEIGMLSENVNALYQSLLATIDDLQRENARVSQAEAAKVDFLRAASHELKTPVTALQGMLDNMIMGVGRYRDWETYLPVCRDMAGRFGVMIQEILDASRPGFSQEAVEEVPMGGFMEKVLSPYLLIAKAKGVQVDTDFSHDFTAGFPVNAMEKALSNVLSNAVKYTKPSGKVNVCFRGRAVVIENECEPIQASVLTHIFEPFYRPDFSRSRNQGSENPEGGNGLGLYIAAKVLTALPCRFSFEPFGDTDKEGHRGMRFTVFFQP
nr:HAMP domain-containing sensor histidine kinase [uncultured Acetatifactor sp.]